MNRKQKWLTMATVLMTAAHARAGVVQVRDALGGTTSSGASQGYFAPGTASSIRVKINGGSWDSQAVGLYAFEFSSGGVFATLPAFCFEPTQALSFGKQPEDTAGKTYSLVSLASDMTATTTQKNYVGRLWANAYATASTGTVGAAAFQAVLWELLQDSSPSFSSGNFRLSGDHSFTSQVKSLAQQWMNNLNSDSWTQSVPVYVLRSGASQDLITSVPEPGTLALLAMAGLLALHRRRRHA